MKIPFSSAAYETRGLLASAQRCLNLYTEKNPQDAEAPISHYQTAGLRKLRDAGSVGLGRGMYRASNGKVFACVGPNIYAVDEFFQFTPLGTIEGRTTPVYFSDNGETLFIVDGTSSGYLVNLASFEFSSILDLNFYGADRVDYIDTFMVMNRPGTPGFYTTLSNTATFDPLYYAEKTGFSDNIVTLVTVNRNIWLLGEVTTEIWTNTGAPDFPFAPVAGVFIEHGCNAKYSVAKNDLSLFWLSQDKDGKGIVLMGTLFAAKRISTYAIEQELSTYARTDDAIGFCYQQLGHVFYQISFPTAGKTWVYDLGENAWHEKAWLDQNGQENRHRALMSVFAYGKNLALDWQNGALYEFDPYYYFDDTSPSPAPIKRLRSFPHLSDLQGTYNRIHYKEFIADITAGTFDPSVITDSPKVSLRFSDDRGKSYGNPIIQNLGQQGDFAKKISWSRLGMARDRVFELSWSVPAEIVLDGGWVDPMVMGS